MQGPNSRASQSANPANRKAESPAFYTIDKVMENPTPNQVQHFSGVILFQRVHVVVNGSLPCYGNVYSSHTFFFSCNTLCHHQRWHCSLRSRVSHLSTVQVGSICLTALQALRKPPRACRKAKSPACYTV